METYLNPPSAQLCCGYKTQTRSIKTLSLCQTRLNLNMQTRWSPLLFTNVSALFTCRLCCENVFVLVYFPVHLIVATCDTHCLFTSLIFQCTFSFRQLTLQDFCSFSWPLYDGSGCWWSVCSCVCGGSSPLSYGWFTSVCGWCLSWLDLCLWVFGSFFVWFVGSWSSPLTLLSTFVELHR